MSSDVEAAALWVRGRPVCYYHPRGVHGVDGGSLGLNPWSEAG